MRFRPRAFALQLAYLILSTTLFNSLWLQTQWREGNPHNTPPLRFHFISGEEGKLPISWDVNNGLGLQPPPLFEAFLRKKGTLQVLFYRNFSPRASLWGSEYVILHKISLLTVPRNLTRYFFQGSHLLSHISARLLKKMKKYQKEHFSTKNS